MLKPQQLAKLVSVLANRWFQPLTHVSSGGFPRVSAIRVKRGMREKRGENRFAVAQCSAQSVRRVFRTGGLTFEDSRRIAERKSSWLVLYLRARRDGDSLRGFYRRQHFLHHPRRFPGMKDA